MSTRVLLVDDHALIREGLAAVIGRENGIDIVAQAGSVAEAIAAFNRFEPDVIVTDLHMGDGTGLDLTRAIRTNGTRQGKNVGIVILTMHAGDEPMFGAMEAGASAFVGKNAPSSEVIQTIRHAAVSPRSFVCTDLARAMMRRKSGETSRLSNREHEVLELLADGLGASQIGKRLYLSESTAKSHIARIYSKLGAANRAQALVTAMRSGLLSSVA